MALDESLLPWLMLTLTPGVGTRTQRQLLKAFGLPEAIFSSRTENVIEIGGSRCRGLMESEGSVGEERQAKIQKALDWLQRPGNHLVTLADSDYPALLLDLPDPPTTLYVKGERSHLASMGSQAISIVGSRNATQQGVRNAREFSCALARKSWTVVSGMALGIDGAAHEGALAAGGLTVAVIGTGADRIYPARHHDLAHQIATEGLIVSEFPLGTPALAANFPRRNRLIAALSGGILVVEASLESGSLITARLAGDLGREVLAIPGSIHAPQARGCHRLIREGAKLVETVADIEEELEGRRYPVGVMAAIAPDDGMAQTETLHHGNLEGDSRFSQLLDCMGHDPVSPEQLATILSWSTSEIVTLLMELELEGQAETLPGGRYQRIGP